MLTERNNIYYCLYVFVRCSPSKMGPTLKGVPSCFSAIFMNANNFYDFLFESLDDMAI